MASDEQQPYFDPDRVDAISFERLEKDPDAPLAVSLMVAANDLFFDFCGLEAYLDSLPNDIYRNYMQQSAVIYHTKLVCSRMLECLDLIPLINQNAYFRSIIERDPQLLAAFERLLGTKKGTDLHNLLERVRNNGSFHYESLVKLFRQLFSGSFKPYKENYGIAVIFPEQKTFFQRYFLADTMLSALMISKIFPAPGERPKSEEELNRDRDKVAETIRDFAMDLYRVMTTLLSQFLHDQQQAEQADRRSQTSSDTKSGAENEAVNKEG